MAGKGWTLSGVQVGFLLLKTMGKRSAFFFAAFLLASAVQVETSVATAQTMDTGTGVGTGDINCPSGIYSSVDGSCVGSDQSLGLGQAAGQPGSTAGVGGAGGYGPGAGAGYGAALAQQYPGLQSQGINARIPSFFDQGGLNSIQSQLEAYYESQSPSFQTYSPPTDFQLMVKASLGNLLPVYGDSLFRRVPSTFAPLRDVNVTPDYVVGPGDQLVIRIWGQVNFNAQVTIDRTGSIYLPQVGEIHVAGLPYSEVQQHVHDAVARIYKNFNLDVEMGQLRAIQVFVVGQARRPGSYTLSSLSTLVTAVFVTGGPSVQGSLRDIQVRRNGKTVTHFDLYDLLILGDMSKDVPLLPGDVIYIPPVGPQVAVSGSVHNPAIYELKDSTSVEQVLQFAGGLSSTASVLHASLERIDEHQSRTVLDLSLQGAGLQTQLRQGDLLRIIPISPEFRNSVMLRGNVAEPGRFSWHEGMKLSDIIPDSKSLITRDYWERRNQLGIPGPPFKPEYAINPDLYPRNVNGYQSPPQFDSRGFPIYNNQYQYPTNGQGQGQQNPNLPGYVPNRSSAQLYNQSNGYQGYNQSSNQNSDLNCDPNPTANSLNQNYPPGSDANTGQQNPNGVRNLPPCTAPGGGALATGEEASRGNLPRPPLTVALPVPEIDWSYAVIERMDPHTLTTSLVPFNPGQLVLDHDPSQDLTLEPGDVVTIFSQADIKVPQEQRTKFVRLEGEFKQPGIYTVEPGETLRQLVKRAGGLTPDAYLFGSEFTRESTRAIQQLRLNDYVQTLQLDIDRATIAAAANGFAVDVSATQASRSLVNRFQAVRATGRIVLNMSPHATRIDDLPDLTLEDGDTFTVPSRPITINVVGAVYNQNSFVYQQSRPVGGYLQLAGGPTQSAESKDAFIIRADGSVISRRSQSGVFGNTFASAHLNAGDTVVVPEKVPKPSALRNFLAYSQLFSSLALGAAAIAVLQ